MAVRKLKGSWWVDFMYDHERLRRRSPLNTKGGAEAFEVTLRREVAAHRTVEAFLRSERESVAARARTQLIFAAFAERWMREYVAVNNKPSEQNNKRLMLQGHLLPHFGARTLGELSPAAIEAYKAEKIASGLGPKTINNHLALLSRCLRVAEEWGLLDRPPKVRLLKAPPPTFQYLSATEFARLCAAAPLGLWKAMIVTAARTGLRFSELAALQWEDVDVARGAIIVRRANVRGWLGTPKNNRFRTIPLTPEVLAALAALPRTSPLVFSHDDRWIRHEQARRRLLEACKAARIKPVGWHDLRHTFASHLVQAGASITAVKELLGHSTLTMTLRYAHLDDTTLRHAVSLLESPAAEASATWCQPEPVFAPAAVPAFTLQGSNLRST